MMTRALLLFAILAACGHSPSSGTTDAAPDAAAQPAYANQATLTLPMPIKGEHFGAQIAISGDGRTIAVGSVGPADANGLASGGVYIFALGADAWMQQAYLKPAVIHPGDSFGSAVKLSGDGATLVVGAQGESSAATGVDGDANDHSATGAGAAYVFKRHGGNWGQQAYLKASNTDAGDGFGAVVVIASDGNTVAVSASLESSGAIANQLDNSASQAGAVYVFTTTGATWIQQAYLKASNLEAHDFFGYSLAMSADGSTLAVGASDEDSAAMGVDGDQTDNSAANAGAAYIFHRTGGAWTQTTYLKSSRPTPGAGFGTRLALSGLGTTLVATAQFERRMDPQSNVLTNAGAAYVFAFDGAQWTQTSLLEAVTPGAFEEFGVPAISADGRILAARLPGAAMFTGEVLSYAETAGTWQTFAQPTPPMLAVGDAFGVDVGLSHDGSTLVVSASMADVGATDTGAVYVFY